MKQSLSKTYPKNISFTSTNNCGTSSNRISNESQIFEGETQELTQVKLKLPT